MSIVSDYFEAREKLLDSFGFESSSWRVFPLDDRTGEHWMLVGGDHVTGEGAHVVYQGSSGVPMTVDAIRMGKVCSGSIYTQRHLPRWIWRSASHAHTMMLVETGCDMNTLLMVFDDGLEITLPEARRAYAEDWGDGGDGAPVVAYRRSTK